MFDKVDLGGNGAVEYEELVDFLRRRLDTNLLDVLNVFQRSKASKVAVKHGAVPGTAKTLELASEDVCEPEGECGPSALRGGRDASCVQSAVPKMRVDPVLIVPKERQGNDYTVLDSARDYKIPIGVTVLQ